MSEAAIDKRGETAGEARGDSDGRGEPLTPSEYLVRFIGLKVIGLDGAIALFAVAVALWMTVAVHVVFEPLWGYTTRVFYPFLLKTLPPISIIAALVVLLRRSRGYRPLSKVVSRPFWHAPNVLNLLRCLGLLYFITMAISNIKPLIPLYNSHNFDQFFRRVDTWLFFGNDPFVWLSQFRQEWLQLALDVGYVSLFIMYFITISMLFVQKRAAALRSFILAVLLASVLGNFVHFVIPTTGDVYTYDHWYLYDDISPRTISRRLQIGLYRAIEVIRADPQSFSTAPFIGIAAFPSLHTAQLWLFCVLAWWYHRWLLWAYIPLGVLLTISTMYFGWHYFTDIIGGFILAWFAMWLARNIIARNLRLNRRLLHHAASAAPKTPPT